MSRVRRGWALTKKSWGLLREHPALLRFPLYGGVATILCAIVGTFVVLLGLAFIGEGVSHGSLAGLALGFRKGTR